MYIEKNFSKGSRYYDQEAYVQQMAAQKLGGLLKTCHIPAGPVLEIGCGTGFVTEHLTFPDVTATDISPAMLAICQGKFPEYQFACLDGEQFQEKERYALIISGLTFQWFQNFQQSLLKLFEGLKSEGVLLFSFLEKGSFPEWKSICKDLEIPFTGNPLPSREDLPFPCDLWEETITLSYPNALSCLKSMKTIGAGACQKRLNYTQMARLLREWDRRGARITYNIVYGAMHK